LPYEKVESSIVVGSSSSWSAGVLQGISLACFPAFPLLSRGLDLREVTQAPSMELQPCEDTLKARAKGLKAVAAEKAAIEGPQREQVNVD